MAGVNLESIDKKKIEVPNLEAHFDLSETSPQAKREVKDLYGDEARSEDLKSTLHWGVTLVIRILVYVAAFVVAVRALHLILPASCAPGALLCHWLSPAQLRDIDGLLLSGMLGAVVNGYIRGTLRKQSQRDATVDG